MNAWQQFVTWLLLGLRPPDCPDDMEDAQAVLRYRRLNKRWKHAIGFSVWLTIVCGAIFVLWARGSLIDFIGPGFARAEELAQRAATLDGRLNQVHDSLTELVASQLRSDLREARRLQCIAKKDQNMELARRYGDEIDRLSETYYTTTTRNWIIPSCDDI